MCDTGVLSTVLNVRCIAGSYPSPTGTVRVDFESSPNEHRVTDDLPSDVIDDTVRLVKLEPPISVSTLLLTYLLAASQKTVLDCTTDLVQTEILTLTLILTSYL